MRPRDNYPGCRCDQPTALKTAFVLRFHSRRLLGGYGLVEVVMAVGIIALVYGVIITSYVQCGLRMEWAGYSLAAQSMACEQVEQARSAVWDPALGKNEITNLVNLYSWTYTSSNQTWSGYTTNILDVPYSSTNYTLATNFVTVQLINSNNTTNPLVQLEMIRVDTVWAFRYRKGTPCFTNTAATLLAPDNRDPSTL